MACQPLLVIFKTVRLIKAEEIIINPAIVTDNRLVITEYLVIILPLSEQDY